MEIENLKELLENNNLKELKINKDIPKINVYLGINKSILPTFASSTFIKYLKR